MAILMRESFSFGPLPALMDDRDGSVLLSLEDSTAVFEAVSYDLMTFHFAEWGNRLDSLWLGTGGGAEERVSSQCPLVCSVPEGQSSPKCWSGISGGDA